MLGDIVRTTLESQPDIEVVGETEGLERLQDAARRSYPDLVIVADPDNRLPDPCLHLMYDHARLRVLVITPDGRSASLHRLLPTRSVIRDISPQGLLDAIRGTELPPAEA
jgi:DNA-binding NarL/FixJ family response regulator